MKRSKFFERVSYKDKDIKKIIDGLTWKSYQEWQDDINDDGMSDFLTATYSGKQHFGITDYHDHREDDFETIKAYIKNQLKTDRHQRGHFYDSEGDPVETIKIKGTLGGLTGVFVYKTGKNYFRS